MSTLEERLERLEKELAETKHQLAREQAVTQIQNVMARYTLFHSGGRQKECLDLFAMRTPDVGRSGQHRAGAKLGKAGGGHPLP